MNDANKLEWVEVNEPLLEYKNDYPLQNETYKIIGACMEVHKELGKGFLEVVYKDAISIIFEEKSIDFEREKKFDILFRGKKLKHFYFADFIVFDKIVLEVKAQNYVIDEHYKQVLNYLAVSKCEIGLIVNFGENSLQYKRVVLSK